MYSLLLAIIYIAFISLGLPDPLLGSAWPVMHVQLGVSLSYAGIMNRNNFICPIIKDFSSYTWIY